VYSNSYWRADFLAGYTVQGLGNNRRLSFQLNVFNVFNERDPLVTRFADDGSVFREVVQAPTTWRFTTSFEF
jgi:outer membrane receptor for monomeric catechols